MSTDVGAPALHTGRPLLGARVARARGCAGRRGTSGRTQVGVRARCAGVAGESCALGDRALTRFGARNGKPRALGLARVSALATVRRCRPFRLAGDHTAVRSPWLRCIASGGIQMRRCCIRQVCCALHGTSFHATRAEQRSRCDRAPLPAGAGVISMQGGVPVSRVILASHPTFCWWVGSDWCGGNIPCLSISVPG